MAVSQYLAELIRDKKWAEALRAGEQLLLRQDNSTEDLAWIHFAISAGRIYHHNDYAGGIAPATVAANLAHSEGMYWLYGRVLLDLTMALADTRQYDRALHGCEQILAHLDHYGDDRNWFCAVAMHNIGYAYRKKGLYRQAIWALREACRSYDVAGRPDRSFIMLGQLLMCHVEADDTHDVPSILRQMRVCIRSHGLDRHAKALYFSYTALYRFSLGRWQRAADLGVRALTLQTRREDLSFSAHMLLCKCSRALGEQKAALGHALAARMAAVEIRRYDLEFEALEAMMEVIHDQGQQVVMALDQDYRAIGIDLTRFVSETALPQRN